MTTPLQKIMNYDSVCGSERGKKDAEKWMQTAAIQYTINKANRHEATHVFVAENE